LQPKIIFHIGLERTGSTSFQRFCCERKRELLVASVLYPTRNFGFARGNHAPLASCYFPSGRRDFNVVLPPTRKAAVIASLLDEIKSSGAEVGLLSSEHLSSRLAAPQILELAADFQQYECQIVVVVRDHIARFFSSYSTHVIAGGVTPLENYADAILQPQSLYCRYAETIKLWEKGFGRERILVIPYGPKGDAVRAIFDRIGVSTIEAPPQLGHRANRSYGPAATEALRQVNVMLTDRASGSNSADKWERQNTIRSLIRRTMERSGNDPHAGVWDLSRDRLAQLQEIAAADRLWLAEHYGVRLPDEFKQREPLLASASFDTRKLLERADFAWRASGLAMPLFAAAPFVSGLSRRLLNRIGRR
jgi:hypothetical protein